MTTNNDCKGCFTYTYIDTTSRCNISVIKGVNKCPCRICLIKGICITPCDEYKGCCH